jgi:hypothetical protein
MTLAYLIDRTYWAVLILSPLAYAVLNLETYKRTGKSYMLYLFLLSISIFLTTSLAFLMRYSGMIHGNLPDIRIALLVIPIVRVPLDVYFYFRLVRDLPAPPTEQDPFGL